MKKGVDSIQINIFGMERKNMSKSNPLNGYIEVDFNKDTTRVVNEIKIISHFATNIP